MIPLKISSPTCEELGIPRHDCGARAMHAPTERRIRNPSLHIDGLRYQTNLIKSENKLDPFSPLCMIPLPSQFPYLAEPSLIRKRNERERERVKCVNDGYSRLKDRLPMFKKGKRVSKVDTLRGAIDYIRHLETILSGSEVKEPCTRNSCYGETTGKSVEEALNSVASDNSDVFGHGDWQEGDCVMSDDTSGVKRECVHSA